MLKDLYKDMESRMQGAVTSLEENISGIRTGRANPALVEHLSVEYYGTQTPLMQIANITVPDARTLMIRPFDSSSLKDIERAILVSNLGLTPNNDGKVIRLNLPPLTEERRKELVKIVHTRTEEARVAVRNIRRDGMKDLDEFKTEKLISEDDQKRGEDELQKITDRFIDIVEKAKERKEKEIMEV